MNSTSTLMWGMIFGSIGLGFFAYGKKQKALVPLLSGIGLIVCPYFISNTYILVLSGIVLMALPYFIRKWTLGKMGVPIIIRVKKFEQLLMSCNFHVRRFRVPAYKGGKSQSRFVWVAAEDKILLPPGGGEPRLPVKKNSKRNWRRKTIAHWK